MTILSIPAAIASIIVLCLILGLYGLVPAVIMIICFISQSVLNSNGVTQSLDDKIAVTEEKITIFDDLLR